jgi:acyl-CoA thioester hydrolase
MSHPHRPPEFESHPFSITLPIQWGDQDAFGHVNNAIYFRWFESARVAYLDQAPLCGLLEQHGLGPILASIKCDYKKQLTYPDTIQISASVTKIGRASVDMAHLLYSERLKAVAAIGESTIVVFDYASQRPKAVPDDVRAAVEKIEGRPLPPGEKRAT